LRFCNRCGASLGAGSEAPPRLLAIIIVLSIAVAVVTIVGLLFMLVLGTEMMGRRDSTAETYIFIATLFLTVLGADALMVRQISRLLTIYLRSEPQNTRAEGRDISKASAPELASPAAAETAVLHHPDTHQVSVDRHEEESPTRKL
jgi:hypothetical protein